MTLEGLQTNKAYTLRQTRNHAIDFSLEVTARKRNTGDLCLPGKALALPAIISPC